MRTQEVSRRGAKVLWQTWWSIIGPRMPQSETRLNSSIVLAPLSRESFDLMKAHRAPVPSLNASTDSFIIHYPPRDEVQSRYKLQIDVKAIDEGEACEIATRIADRLLLSLTLVVPGGRYHAELRKLRQENSDQEITGWSDTVSISPLSEPGNLDEREILRTLRLSTVLESDAVAENAYIHLLSAWRLESTPGSRPLQRSVLQHYVLCLEAVVNGTMKKLRAASADKIREDERKFANEFAEELPKRSNKPEAIRNASTRLREIACQNMIPSISEVAPVLKLSDEILQHAKNLYRFRSSNLSHPGKSRKEDLEKWLRSGPSVEHVCLASQVAEAFLRGYCDNIE